MKKVQFLALACAVVMSLCACGSTEQTQPDSTVASEVTGEIASSTPESQPEEMTVGFAAEAEKMIGEWTGICAESVYYEDGDESRHFYFYGVSEEEDEYYSEDMSLLVYKEDGKLRMDNRGDSDYGMELIPTAGAAYATCKNSTWKADVKYGHSDRMADITTTLISDNVLELVSRYDYDDGSYSVYCVTYFRNGSDEYDHADDYRYPNQVTVSNAYDLIQAIDSNTKITLTAGEYDLTSFGRYSGISNLCIEGAEGEKVELITREASDPVLWFENSDRIVIRGITAGHQIERGYCNGSVLEFENCSEVTVEGCRLYGCGTYGISAYNCYRGWVSDTEIYECSEGLVYLLSCGYWTFDDCEMRDTEGIVPIDTYDCWNIQFQFCDFHDVEVGAECYFASASDLTLTFNSCTFTGLDEALLCDTDIYVVNCTFQ